MFLSPTATMYKRSRNQTGQKKNFRPQILNLFAGLSMSKRKRMFGLIWERSETLVEDMPYCPRCMLKQKAPRRNSWTLEILGVILVQAEGQVWSQVWGVSVWQELR